MSYYVNSLELQSEPITFVYEHAARRRIATFCGAVGDRDLYDAYASLLRESTYDASVDDLIDLRRVTHMAVTSAGLHRLIALYDGRASGGFATRAAIVAPTDVLFGVARMFQTLRGDANPDEVEVFRNLEGALLWLERRDAHVLSA